MWQSPTFFHFELNLSISAFVGSDMRLSPVVTADMVSQAGVLKKPYAVETHR
jgi:hypothetical protein